MAARDPKSAQTRLVMAALALLSLVGCQLVAGDFDIKQNTTESQGLCKAGEFRCNGEYLLTCTPDRSDWMLDDTCATADLCDSKLEQCRVCGIGDQRCDGASRQECNEDGTAWVEIEMCESDAMCNPTFCGSCRPGEFACRGSGDSVDRELWECSEGGVWSMKLDTCETPGVCTASLDMALTDPNWSKTCIDAVCTDPGAYRCEGQELRRCRQDLTGWDIIDTCASVALCEQGVANATVSAGLVDMCPLGCTSPGSVVCDGLAITKCRDDLTGYDYVTTCEEGTDCNPLQGVCTGPCTEGEVQCNGAQLRRCRADHSWEELDRCASPVLCVTQSDGVIATSGECLPPACPMAGVFSCEGAALYECRQDLSTWDTAGTCYSADLCSAADKRCNEPTCAADELKCFGNELRRCNEGLTGWDMVETCETGEFCSNDAADPGCKLECPSPTRCNGAELERCTPNGWVHSATCATNDLCSCTLNGGCTLGLGTDGCGAPVCGATLPGYRCTGATLQKCQTGRNGWDTATQLDCGSAALCYPGAAPMFQQGYCATCPTAGEVRCFPPGNPTGLQTCSADRKTWNATQTCGALGCVEFGSMDYCATCAAGVGQCSATTLQVCGADRKTLTPTTCTSAALCDAAGAQCDICRPLPDPYSCVSKVLHHCSADGQADQLQTCANVCDAVNHQCDACVASTSRCSDNILFKCSADGQSEAQSTCATTALCNATAQRCDTPTCALTDRQCVGAQPQKCNSSRNGWENDGAACVNATLCASGIADGTANGNCTAPVCAAGERRCTSTGQPQLCKPNRDGWDDVTPCATAALCITSGANKGTCQAPACDAGQIRCNGAQPERCKADRTGFENMGTVCDSAGLCNADGTCRARACNPNQTQCVGAQPQICKGDLTGYQNAGPACITAGLCNASSGICSPPACAVGDKQCSGAQPQKCKADRTGFENDGPACATQVLCVGGSCQTPTCMPGDKHCTGPQPEQCNSGQNGWTPLPPACATAGLCNATTGTCNTATCMPGQTRCNGAQPEECNDMQTGWKPKGAACATMALCVASNGTCTTPTCAPTDHRCNLAQPQICNSDRNGWDNSGSACASAALCSGGVCTAPTCMVNELRCSSAQPQICNDDRNGWDNNGTACATAALCVMGACNDPACLPMERRCVPLATGEASLQQCNQNQTMFQELAKCASAALCSPSSSMCTPPACAVNERRCVGPVVEQCLMDRSGFETLLTCSAASLCDAQTPECDECDPGDLRCGSPTSLDTCNAQGHWIGMECTSPDICDADQLMCVPPPG